MTDTDPLEVEIHATHLDVEVRVPPRFRFGR